MKVRLLIKTVSWVWIGFIVSLVVFMSPLWLQKALGICLLVFLTLLALVGTQQGKEEYSKPKPPPLPENYKERINKRVRGLKQK